MRKQLFATFATLGFLLVLTAGVAQAQVSGRVNAHIPFNFQIGDKQLPAGDYSIKRVSQNALLIESTDKQQQVLMPFTEEIDNGPNAKQKSERLVFRQYGERYFLAQIWMSRATAGRELTRTDAEREAARALKLAEHGAQPKTVEVAGR